MPQLATNWDREQVLALPEDGQRHDRLVKRSFYQRQGVPEYWIVDFDALLVERWRPGDARPEILTDRLEWQPDPAQEPMVIDLRALFAEIGEE